MLSAMREMITRLLEPFADACYALVSLIPLEAVGVIYILVLVILAVWVLTLKQEKVTGAGEPRRCVFLSDLRLWAVLILFIQAIIYVLLR